MRASRRRLGAIVGAWLLCEIATFAAAPIAICAPNRVPAAGQVCTCGDAHEAGRACPMHHPDTHPSKSSCSCRSTTDVATMAVASLLGPIAVLPPAVDVAAPLIAAESLERAGAAPLDAVSLPDAPPPRA